MSQYLNTTKTFFDGLNWESSIELTRSWVGGWSAVIYRYIKYMSIYNTNTDDYVHSSINLFVYLYVYSCICLSLFLFVCRDTYYLFINLSVVPYLP